MDEILKQLANPVGFGMAASLILEWVPQFQKIADAQVKKLVALAVGVTIGMLAYAASVYVPAAWWALVDPYLKIGLAGVAAYGGMQIFHRNVNTGV